MAHVVAAIESKDLTPAAVLELHTVAADHVCTVIRTVYQLEAIGFSLFFPQEALILIILAFETFITTISYWTLYLQTYS